MKNLKVWLKIISIMVMGLIGVGASIEMFENDNKLVLIPIVGISILVVVSSTIVFIKDFEDVTNPVEILCNKKEKDNSKEYISAVCKMQNNPDDYITDISGKKDSEKKMLKLNYTTAQKVLMQFTIGLSVIFTTFFIPGIKILIDKFNIEEQFVRSITDNYAWVIYLILACIIIGILIYIIYNFCMFKALKMNNYIENYLFDIEPIKDNDSNQPKS